MTLSQTELTESRDQLKQAKALINTVRDKYYCAGYVEGARILNEVSHLLDDEVAALEKMIAG